MNTYDKIYSMLTEIRKAEKQPERRMSGTTRAYKKAFTHSWQQGGRSGELMQKAAEGEQSGSYIGGLHSNTMRTVAKTLRKKSAANLETAIRLRPLVPQSRTRKGIRTRDENLRKNL